jgi:2-methylcitrate dehydratase PrpD
MAARNGLLAAQLAAIGFTANSKALEAAAGFFAMHYPQTRLSETSLEELGKNFALVSDGIKIKPYPCGGLTHIAIDSVLALRAEHGITTEMVDAIEVDVLKHVADRIVFRVPQTGVQGKFCMNYLLARAVIDGKIALDVFTDEAVRDAKVLALGERVTMRTDPQLKTNDLGGRPCRVTVRLKNGHIYTRYGEHAKGSSANPLSAAELRTKYLDCARQALDEKSAERALTDLQRLETLPDLRPLCAIMRG